MNRQIPTIGLEDDGRKLSIPIGDILNNVAIGYELKDIGSDTVDLYGDDSEAVFFLVDRGYKHFRPETKDVILELEAGQILQGKVLGETLYRTGYVTVVTNQVDVEGESHEIFYFIHRDDLLRHSPND